MPAPRPVPIPEEDAEAPAFLPTIRPPAPAPTLVARTQCRAVTAALHRGPVVGVAHDPTTGAYRLVVNLR